MSAETLRLLSDANPAGYRELLPEGAAQHLDRLRVIDVRQPAEFHGELGHIPGAELVTLDTLAEAATGWDRAAPLLLVCRSGQRSAAASASLVWMGFQAIYNLVGGMLVWNQSGLPVEREG